jgi:predicted dehydrogenase
MPPVGNGEAREIGVGMLGYAFMGKAHSRAMRAVRELDPPLLPELVSISGRNREALDEVAKRFGWQEAVSDWREQVADDRVELFVNGGPNSIHAEPSIAALEAGKHVLCEKPLGLDAAESYRMWQAAVDAGTVHACGFNYRFVPAIRRARDLIEAGAVGDIVHFRARYLQSWGWDADTSIWRFDRAQAATGAIGDLGTHIIDLARFLAGEIETIAATVRTYVPGHEVDDAFTASIELSNGAIGTLEATRLARGRVNQPTFEINGSKGSIAYDLEHFDELYVSDGGPFRIERVTGDWWPPGHLIGWGDTFTLEYVPVLSAIAGDGEVAPYCATFEDGYRAAEVCDAIQRSSESGQKERIEYR